MTTLRFLLAVNLFTGLLATPLALAEDSVFGRAFPEPAREESRGSQSSTMAIETVGGGTAAVLVGSSAHRELGELVEHLRQIRRGVRLRLAPDHPEFAALFRYEDRIDQLQDAVYGRYANSETERQLRELRAAVTTHPLKSRAEALLREATEQNLAGLVAGNVTHAQRFSSQGRTLRFLRALSAAGLAAVIADGGSRLLALAQDRDPGYLPALNLSREAIKAPFEARPAHELRASSTMGAE